MKQEMTEVKQKFTGCERFALYGDASKEDNFLIYEEWQSQANFEAYQTSEYFKKNGEKLFAMMAGAPDSAYFEADVLQQPQA
jgi:quinol monooxygenase YgiN